MKKKVVLMIAFISIFMIGCSKNTESTLINDGKTELEANKYTQAMKTLSSALEEDSSNENARAMYMQAMKMTNVENYINENNYKKAIDELKIIENIKNGSSNIKQKASRLLKELEEKYEQEQKLAQERKENAKVVAGINVNKLNDKIIEEMKNLEENQKEENLQNNNSLEDTNKQESVEQNNQDNSEQTTQSQEDQNTVEQNNVEENTQNINLSE